MFNVKTTYNFCTFQFWSVIR